MTVPCLTNLLPSHLIPMNTTIDRMIVDAQGTLAAPKLALSPLRGSLQRFCHHNSCYKDFSTFLLYLSYHIAGIFQRFYVTFTIEGVSKIGVVVGTSDSAVRLRYWGDG